LSHPLALIDRQNRREKTEHHSKERLPEYAQTAGGPLEVLIGDNMPPSKMI
tara:strand:- start:438 stop:590 length:153 start_codon:yes stop_codon:yes gene_type:complete